MLTKEQLLERKNYIGGSDIPIILNKSNFKSAYQLWQEKTGQTQIQEKPMPFVNFGNAMEKYISLEFIKKYPEYHSIFFNEDLILNKLTKEPRFFLPNTYIYPSVEWARANIDGAIVKNGLIDTILEIKTSSMFKVQNQIKENYIYQVQWYMFVCNCQRSIILLLDNADNTLIEHFIPRDDNIITYIYDEACKFWDLVKKGEPPQKFINSDFEELNKKTCVEADLLTFNMLTTIKDLKKQKKDIEKEIEDLELKIKQKLDKNEFLIDENNKKLASFSKTEKEVFNKDLAKENLLKKLEKITDDKLKKELYSKYFKKSEYRVLRIK